MLRIIEKSKLWIAISLVIIIIGMTKLAVSGLNFGIDFLGGTVMVVEMGTTEFNNQDVQAVARKYADDAVTRTMDGTSVEIRSNKLDSANVMKVFAELQEKYELDDKALVSQEEISAAIGSEMTRNSLIAIGIATIAMLLYVALRFEYRFGISAIVALAHDVLITLSVFAIFRIPVNMPFIAAMLTIIGYSINDTIVTFDRVRENLKTMRNRDVVEVANISINQTITRSINTTLTTLATIAAVYYFVPAVRDFAFPIILGILAGAYSSIFIASPVWVMLKKRQTA
jgi:preprotein translocase subunit SecF